MLGATEEEERASRGRGREWGGDGSCPGPSWWRGGHGEDLGFHPPHRQCHGKAGGPEGSQTRFTHGEPAGAQGNGEPGRPVVRETGEGCGEGDSLGQPPRERRVQLRSGGRASERCSSFPRKSRPFLR